jgi:hypothetical protein
VSGAWIPPVELAQRNDSGAEGYRFEPYRAYHSINNLQGYETDGKPQADGLELDRDLGPDATSGRSCLLPRSFVLRLSGKGGGKGCAARGPCRGRGSLTIEKRGWAVSDSKPAARAVEIAPDEVVRYFSDSLPSRP